MARANATIDHDLIRKWVEERGGKPASVKGSGKGDDPGILRIDFPGFSGESTLEEISWDEWFKAFEANHLAFLYQEETVDHQPSRFNKLVSRESADLEAQGQQPAEGAGVEEAEEGEQAEDEGAEAEAGAETETGAEAEAEAEAEAGAGAEAEAEAGAEAGAKKGASDKATAARPSPGRSGAKRRRAA